MEEQKLPEKMPTDKSQVILELALSMADLITLGPIIFLSEFARIDILKVLLSNTTDNEKQTERVAHHEIGHLLRDIFGEDPVTEANLCQFMPITQEVFQVPTGFITSREKRRPYILRSRIIDKILQLFGQKNLYDMGFDEIDSVYELVNIVFGLLAGRAEEEVFTGEEMFDRSRSKFPGTDFNKLKSSLRISQKYNQIGEPQLQILYQDLVEFFSDPKVRNITQILSKELLEAGQIYNGGQELTPTVKKILEEKGVSEAEFEGVKEQYLKLVLKEIEIIRPLIVPESN